MKRLISFILCMLMLLSLVPATSLENGNAVFSDIRLAASDIQPTAERYCAFRRSDIFCFAKC